MPPKKAADLPAEVHFGRVRNNLRMGIVGLPNVGKSSLFNLLTSQSAPAENFPFCTIEPNEARCPVPDPRYDFLCDLWSPPSTQPAYLLITDIAGLIAGASEGEGLGNAFLSHIQAVDGIYHVIRIFDDPEVMHVDDSIDPIRDLETIQSELCKKDLDIVKKAQQAEELAVRKSGGKTKLSPIFLGCFEKMTAMLKEGNPVRNGDWSAAEIELINEKAVLITTKPIVYLANMTNEDYIRKKNKWLPKVHAWIQAHGGGPLVPFSIQFEKEQMITKHAEIQSALPKMITLGYSQLNLIYFFTAGEKEVRAWTVYAGSPAPVAASVIHTDFGKAFIKAEVVSFEDYKSLCGGQKSMAPIKAAGKYRIEGKSYIVKDGDLCFFQIGTIQAVKKV